MAPVSTASTSASTASPFTASEIATWRKLLILRRAQLVGDIEDLVHDALDVETMHPSSNHLAEGGSDADLQVTSLGLADDDQAIVQLIDRALAKIDGESPLPYGVCEYTREPIARERLELIPWTPLSIEGATHLEENYLTLDDLSAE